MTLASSGSEVAGDDQKKRDNDVLIIVLVVALSLFLLSFASWFLFAPLDRASETLILVAAGLVALIGALLVRQGQQVAGVLLALLALFGAYLYLTVQFSGIGALAAVVLAIVASVVIVEAFPRTYVARVVGLALIVSLFLLLLELFWPGPARVALPDSIAPAIILAVAASLVVVAFTLRHYPRYTLREKLVTAFLAVALLPLMIIVLINNNNSRNVLVANANQRLLSAARQAAVTVDDFFVNSLRTIRTEAIILEETGYLDVIQADRADSEAEALVLAQLMTYRDKDPLNIQSYALLDLTGEVLLEYPPNSPQSMESGRDYVTAPMETDRPYASEVLFTPIDGGPFLYLSAPVHDETGRIAAILRGRYKASILQEIIARSTGLVGGRSFAVLYDENLLQLAHGTAPDSLYSVIAPDGDSDLTVLQAFERLPAKPIEELVTELPDLEQKLSSAQTEPLFTTSDVSSGDRVDQVAVTGVDSQPWLVAFFQPQDVFLAPIEEQTRTALLLAVAVTGGVIVLAAVLARLLTGPIIRLEETAELVAQGDLTIRAAVESDDEIGALAETFNLMTSRLEESLLELEQRVADRTQALATSTEVGQRLSTILDQQELVSEVVKQVQSSFGYYHVHIYLLDEPSNDLFMVGGTGRAGQIMLEKGHRIAQRQGLVGRAARLNTVVLAPNVHHDPDWLANPLLPLTNSEIAVPIAVGRKVLGVLDVQDDEIAGLQQEDADLLLSIANQVAIALQNAQSYAELRRQAKRRALINEINRKIQSTAEADKAMQIAVRELGRAVGSRQARVWLEEWPGHDDTETGRNGEGSVP
ncbi:MAG: GAF domain-containing protein [Chloroflexota bacterium]|nr:MAG: GAF domain-containing protein [Chloroflexota bacterium]